MRIVGFASSFLFLFLGLSELDNWIESSYPLDLPCHLSYSHFPSFLTLLLYLVIPVSQVIQRAVLLLLVFPSILFQFIPRVILLLFVFVFVCLLAF